MQQRLVFFPEATLAATPADVGLPFEEVRIPTEDGPVLHGWLVPGAEGAPVVLFCHGNAGNISHRLESLRLFHMLGLSTLIFDYRGYGMSEGKVSEAGTYRDARAVWRYLTGERGVKPERIILFGRSLGGAVAVELATEVRPAALVVESAFTSVPDMAAQVYPFLPVRLLARIGYDSLTRMDQVSGPVLVIHSRDDELVPVEHGRRLFEAAPEPKRFLEIRGSHNDGFIASGKTYVRGWAGFLAERSLMPD